MWINTRRMEARICIRHDSGGSAVVAGSPLHRVTGIAQQYRISEYTKLLFALTLAFVIGFQTPVVVLLLGWAGIIDAGSFKGKRKFVIMGCTIAAAILTPPDPVSMMIMAVPLYLLFELGVLLLKLLPPERIARGLLAREPANAGDE
jgi:Sec-independent protein secretion pathway component TatC